LSESITPSFSILAEHPKCAQDAHGVSKIYFCECINFQSSIFNRQF
jgi:hypothetical protein